MTNILVLIHDDAGQEARIRAAIDLARGLCRQLLCLDVTVIPTVFGDYDGMATKALMIEEEQRESANRTRLEARLKDAGVAHDWIDETGYISPCVRAAANDADFIVLNRELAELNSPDMFEIVGEVLKARKPIVAVPASGGGFDLSGRALVAWDGSKEAENALRSSVPLLARASSVTVLAVDDGSLKRPIADALTYLLTLHIDAAPIRVDAFVERPGAIILEYIKELKASYVVMGGFGHSRFIEAAFGGVTRKMLKECPVPIVLAH